MSFMLTASVCIEANKYDFIQSSFPLLICTSIFLAEADD